MDKQIRRAKMCNATAGGALYPPAPRYCTCCCVYPPTVLATLSSLYSSPLGFMLPSGLAPLLLVRSWGTAAIIFLAQLALPYCFHTRCRSHALRPLQYLLAIKPFFVSIGLFQIIGRFGFIRFIHRFYCVLRFTLVIFMHLQKSTRLIILPSFSFA